MSAALESINFIVIKRFSVECRKIRHITIDFGEVIKPEHTILFYFDGQRIQWKVCSESLSIKIISDLV